MYLTHIHYYVYFANLEERYIEKINENYVLPFVCY